MIARKKYMLTLALGIPRQSGGLGSARKTGLVVSAVCLDAIGHECTTHTVRRLKISMYLVRVLVYISDKTKILPINLTDHLALPVSRSCGLRLCSVSHKTSCVSKGLEDVPYSTVRNFTMMQSALGPAATTTFCPDSYSPLQLVTIFIFGGSNIGVSLDQPLKITA